MLIDVDLFTLELVNANLSRNFSLRFFFGYNVRYISPTNNLCTRLLKRMATTVDRRTVKSRIDPVGVCGVNGVCISITYTLFSFLFCYRLSCPSFSILFFSSSSLLFLSLVADILVSVILC